MNSIIANENNIILRLKLGAGTVYKKLLNQAFPSVSYSENKFVNVREDKSLYDEDIAYLKN